MITYEYALIKNGVVENVIIVDCDATAEQIKTANGCDTAINCDAFSIGIGDSYTNGNFLRNGTIVLKNADIEASNAQQIVTLQAALIDAQTAINSLLGV
jgi:hypothetical protein